MIRVPHVRAGVFVRVLFKYICLSVEVLFQTLHLRIGFECSVTLLRCTQHASGILMCNNIVIMYRRLPA